MLEDRIELPADLVRAGRRDADHIADITADAFRDDPFNRWLVGKFSGIHAVFRTFARTVYTTRGYSYRLGDEGAAMWMMPGGSSDVPLAAIPGLAWTVIAKTTPGAIKRFKHTIPAMEQNHPGFPHAYLFTIAVRPRAQGKGLGRKLIQPVLDACDREAVPAYLENSNPDNSGFYGACGFERTTMIHPTPDAEPLEAMLRRPR